MDFAGNWYSFDEAPVGSYACIWAPDGTLQGASLSWMPLSREQIPPNARRGLVMPIPAPPVHANQGAGR